MQSQVKHYQPPAPRWTSIVRGGKLLFRFDAQRGVIEIKQRNEMHVIDLAAEVEKHEQQALEPMQIVS